MPAEIEALALDRYTLVHEERAGESAANSTWDQQDALYLPSDGLEGYSRMGPSLRLYRLKPSAQPSAAQP